MVRYRSASKARPLAVAFATCFAKAWDTRRPLSSYFLGLPYRILSINHKKELLRVRFLLRFWVSVVGFFWVGEGMGVEGEFGCWVLGSVHVSASVHIQQYEYTSVCK